MGKRLLFVLASLAAISGMFYSCEHAAEEVAVSSVTISQPLAELIIGETIQLTAIVSPSNATDQEVTWASSKQSVATVDKDGRVDAVSEGISTITAIAGGKVGTCIVTVSKGFVAVDSIGLDYTVLPLVEEDEFTLNATIKPDDATDKTITWTSSDNKIVVVDNSGKIKAIKEGEAIVIAQAGDKTAECKVTVKAKKIEVSMVMLSKTTLSMIVGDEQTLTATIIPDNATVQTVQWSSSDSSIATVEDGKVKAIKEGHAKVVAYVDGKTAECAITVNYIPVQKITLDKSTLSLYEGEDYSLSATITPDNATYKDITWTSNNPNSATVDGGKVVAVKRGSATIKAEANGKYTLCQVDVLSSLAEISLSKSNLSMIVGDTETITAIITPSDATLRESIQWATSDKSIATVDDNGKVKAIKEGSAIITATVEGKKAECKVSVDYIHLSSIDISQKEATLYVGQALTLTATLNPSNVTYSTIKWESSNNGVVTVNENGCVTAVGKGTAIVTAKSNGQEANCSFTVLVPLTSLTFDQSSLSLFNGATAQLSIIKTPSDATFKGEVTWQSSNTSVATVSTEGLVTAINKGSATITASVDGCKAICNVSVLASVTGISLHQTSATLNKGETLQLSYSITPTGATLQEQVVWTSSDTSVATVDNQGNVKAIGAGSADIKVSLEGFSAICNLTVLVPVASISLNQSVLSIIKGDTYDLIASISPSDATNKTITWTSTDDSVASVSNNGRITAKSSGNTTIKASIGNIFAECEVTVIVPVSSVKLSRTTLSLKTGNGIVLYATVNPSDATNKSVEWTSSDENVATVSSSGTVTAVGNGDAIITVTTIDGGFTSECKVSVTTPVTSVSIAPEKPVVEVGSKIQMNAIVLPEDASNKAVTWTSNKPDIATIDENGLIYGVSSGTATITVTTQDGGFSSYCYLTVVSLNSFAFRYPKITIDEGMTVNITKPSVHSYYLPLTYTSSNPSVAYISEDGALVGVSRGTATIIATTAKGGGSATLEVTVSPYVDLGLSVKWGVCNLKATTIEGYGGYAAWGDGCKEGYIPGQGANVYSWYTYKWGSYPGTHILKYVCYYQNGIPHTDDLSVLEPEDDAATVTLGAPWRMPTAEEWSELESNCKLTAHTLNGVKGVLINSKINNQCMFIPYAGYYLNDDYHGTELLEAGKMAYCWSSSLSSSVNSAAKAFFYPKSGYWAESERCAGLSIRPVYDE